MNWVYTWVTWGFLISLLIVLTEVITHNLVLSEASLRKVFPDEREYEEYVRLAFDPVVTKRRRVEVLSRCLAHIIASPLLGPLLIYRLFFSILNLILAINGTRRLL
jgi:hypothetical protein